METNNKLREALERAKDIARTIYSTSEMGSHHEDLADKIVELANAALAEPVKNCDMGTLTEQQKRFDAYCEKMQHTDKACCGGCPIVVLRMKGVIDNSCELAWAQMPYEEGGAK